MTWPQIVDACLIHGWIDGVRKTIDETAWKIRLTPRRKGSRWSNINVARAEALTGEGRMTPAGKAAFEARDPEDARRYAYEREMAALAPDEEERFRAKTAAWAFWEAGAAVVSPPDPQLDDHRQAAGDARRSVSKP